METQQTMDGFLASIPLSLTATPTDRNPHMEDAQSTMNHWRCTISHQKTHARMVITYSMGSAHHGKKPKLGEILDCLSMGASALDQSFDDWCSDFGYETDSRKAERTYKACRKQAESLKRVLGPVLFEQLVNDVERL